MKNLWDSRFFNVWNLLLSKTDPGPHTERWSVEAVDWSRERHGFWCADHAFRVEVHRLTCAGHSPWSLMVVSEYWWDETRKDPIRLQRWSRITRGRTADAIAWFRRQESLLQA